MFTKIKQMLDMPSAWRTAPKVSEWVDDVNNMPWKFEGEIINNEDMLPSWDIVFKYFDGRTEKMKIKYKKRDGYSNYKQMQTIYKCILKNWKERK